MKEVIKETISIVSPIIVPLIVVAIMRTGFRIAMNFCRCNWTIEDEKDEEENIIKESKEDIDEDLKKYFNYEEEKG